MFPIFVLSFCFNQNIIFNEYLSYIAFFYIVVIILNFFKYKTFLIILDRAILLFLALLVFVNNNIEYNRIFLTVLVLCICIITIHIALFFVYKKLSKKFVLNFHKLSCIIEFIFAVSLIVFGINHFVTVYILFTAMSDVIYKIVILSTILNLNKKFNI